MAFANRPLSQEEKNYGITELETLAAVWVICQYHGHKVVVMTDHSAVKAVLETSRPNGKYVRWWIKMFNLEVLYKHCLSSWKRKH